MSVKLSVVFAAAASPLHIERARETASKAFSALSQEGAELLGAPEPILEPEGLSEAISTRADLRIIFVASGGTSRLLRRALAGVEAILWAHPGDNSLPSALSAREKLKAAGDWKAEIAFSSPKAVPYEIRAELRAIKALKEFGGAEVLAICDENVAAELDGALSALGPWKPRLKRLDPRRLAGCLEAERGQMSLGEAVSALKGIEVEHATQELEEGIVRGVQLAELLQREAEETAGRAIITFDCFRVMEEFGVTPCVAVGLLLERGITAVCEADPAALVLMAACHVLSGEPPWMANLARFDRASNTLTLAHCTACPSLAASWPYRGVLLEHFETGKPAALDIWLRRGPIILANLQLGRRKLVLARGEVRDSGLGDERLCRTQALIKLKGDLEAFLAETSNHHVICYADIYEELSRLGRRLGLEVVAL